MPLQAKQGSPDPEATLIEAGLNSNFYLWTKKTSLGGFFRLDDLTVEIYGRKACLKFIKDCLQYDEDLATMQRDLRDNPANKYMSFQELEEYYKTLALPVPPKPWNV